MQTILTHLSPTSRKILTGISVFLLLVGLFLLGYRSQVSRIMSSVGFVQNILIDDNHPVVVEEEEEEDVFELYSYADIPCVDSICYAACSGDGFTDKFCSFKCEQYEGCVDLYAEDVIDDPQFAVQSISAGDMEFDGKALEITFKDSYDEVALLENYIDGSVDKDLYALIQSKKSELVSDAVSQSVLAANEYLDIALDAYGIETISNRYLSWKDKIADLPTNVYTFTFSTIEDASRFRQDILSFEMVEYARFPAVITIFTTSNDEFVTRQRHLDKFPGTNTFRARELLDQLDLQLNPVHVAMIDDGVANHPDLAIQNSVSQGMHGTHVAGIISAVTDNQKGIASVVKNRANLYAYAGLNDWLNELQLAVSQGAKVVNLSFGCDVTPGRSDLVIPEEQRRSSCRNTHEAQILQYLYEQGVVVVAAAGNDGESASYVTTPAAYPGVIAVGASDVRGGKADFSQFGSNLDILAPGKSVWSTMVPGSSFGDCRDGDGDGYSICDGTSMASPLVTSAVSLLRSIQPDSTVDEVLDILQRSSVTPNDPLKNTGDLGSGILDVCRMVAIATDTDVSFCEGGDFVTTQVQTPDFLCGNGIVDFGEECDDAIGNGVVQCLGGVDCLGCRCGASIVFTTQSTCSDGIHNGDETDIDCGGSCEPCQVSQHCDINNDCIDTLICSNQGTSTTGGNTISGSTSSSGTSGGSGGGSNLPLGSVCSSHIDCLDGEYCNGIEYCDGTCKSGGSSCLVGQLCNEDTDRCENAGTCSNGFLDGDETDVDCGGSCPNLCGNSSNCLVHADCQSGTCQQSSTQALSAGGTSSVVNELEYVPGAYFVQIKPQNNGDIAPIISSFSVSTHDAVAYMNEVKSLADTVYIGGSTYDTVHELLTQTPLLEIEPLFDAQKITTLSVEQKEKSYTIADTYMLKFDTDAPTYDRSMIEAKIFELSGVGEVELVPMMKVLNVPNDPSISNMWYLDKIEAIAAREAGAIGSKSVVVGVVDDGFAQHPDLDPNVVGTYNAMGGSAYNGCTHGTHTAGSVSAVTGNGVGVGAVANNVSLYLLASSNSCTYLPGSFDAIKHAVQQGVDIVSMSFGGPQYSATRQNYINSHPGTIFIAASGNEYSKQPMYPCAYDNVYCVAASTSSDQKAGFSNYGYHVDIAAPGTNILSTVPGGYAAQHGTSMAAPIVSSLAALLMSHGAGDPLSIISSTADPMPTSASFNNGRVGAGRINVCKAVNQVGVSCTQGVTSSGTTSSGTTNSSTTNSGTTTSSSSSTTSGGTSAGNNTGGGSNYGTCVLNAAGGTSTGGTSTGSTSTGSASSGSTSTGSTSSGSTSSGSTSSGSTSSGSTSSGSTSTGSTSTGSTSSGSTSSGSTSSGSTSSGSTSSGGTSTGSTSTGGTSTGGTSTGGTSTGSTNGGNNGSLCEEYSGSPSGGTLDAEVKKSSGGTNTLSSFFTDTTEYLIAGVSRSGCPYCIDGANNYNNNVNGLYDLQNASNCRSVTIIQDLTGMSNDSGLQSWYNEMNQNTYAGQKSYILGSPSNPFSTIFSPTGVSSLGGVPYYGIFRRDGTLVDNKLMFLGQIESWIQSNCALCSTNNGSSTTDAGADSTGGGAIGSGTTDSGTVSTSGGTIDSGNTNAGTPIVCDDNDLCTTDVLTNNICEHFPVCTADKVCDDTQGRPNCVSTSTPSDPGTSICPAGQISDGSGTCCDDANDNNICDDIDCQGGNGVCLTSCNPVDPDCNTAPAVSDLVGYCGGLIDPNDKNSQFVINTPDLWKASECISDGCSYCYGNQCFTGGTCHYYCADSSGADYTSFCATGTQQDASDSTFCSSGTFCGGDPALLSVQNVTPLSFVTQSNFPVACNNGLYCDADFVCDSPCEDYDTCPTDCNSCGNGVCEVFESNSSCPSDCATPEYCGNWICEGSEDFSSCPSDCLKVRHSPGGQERLYDGGCDEVDPSVYDISSQIRCGSASCPNPSQFSCQDHIGGSEPNQMHDYENCINHGVDDDLNGLADCADAKCSNHVACGAVVEICDNYGQDDDGNGLGDCDDPACVQASNCANTTTAGTTGGSSTSGISSSSTSSGGATAGTSGNNTSGGATGNIQTPQLGAGVCVVRQYTGVCGNGTINTGEACDDGNTANNDGCSSVCTNEYQRCKNSACARSDISSGRVCLSSNDCTTSTTGTSTTGTSTTGTSTTGTSTTGTSTTGTSTTGTSTTGTSTTGTSTTGTSTTGTSTTGTSTTGTSTTGTSTTGTNTTGTSTTGTSTTGTSTTGTSTTGTSTTGTSTTGTSTTGTSTTGTSTTGTSTTGGTTTTPQVFQPYPVWNMSLKELNNATPGSDINLRIDLKYTTVGPNYPTGTIHLKLDYPAGWLISSGSAKLFSSDMSLKSSSYLDRTLTFGLPIIRGAQTNDGTRVYEGSLEIPFLVLNTAFETSQFELSGSCLNIGGTESEYTGTANCSIDAVSTTISEQYKNFSLSVNSGRTGVGVAGPNTAIGNTTGVSSGDNSTGSSTGHSDTDGSSTGTHGSANGGVGTGTSVGGSQAGDTSRPQFTDPEEIDDTSCQRGGYEYLGCADTVDNDCDGLIDCADTACHDDPVCTGSTTGGPRCGDADLFQDVPDTHATFEGCDDGNTIPGDGCSSTCKPEPGRGCVLLDGGRSSCTKLECATHAEVYSSHLKEDGYRCCTGLDTLRTYTSTTQIGESGKQYSLCYDPLIGEPYCKSDATDSGRHLKTSADSDNTNNVLSGECLGEYVDYAAEISDYLYDKQDFCFFTDVPYSEITFLDVASSKEKWAIETLLDYCIVKGRGEIYPMFAPGARVSRAEFVKMLVKILAIPQGIDFAPEGTATWGDLPYIDISKSHWAYEYIAYAYKRDIADQFEKNLFQKFVFQPNKSMTNEEIANILARIPEGQQFTTLDVQEMLGDEKYPPRGTVSELLVRKFLPLFRDSLYLQGQNRIYFEELAKSLRGKKQSVQFQIIQSQVEKLDGLREDSEQYSDLYTYWIVEYLKGLMR